MSVGRAHAASGGGQVLASDSQRVLHRALSVCTSSRCYSCTQTINVHDCTVHMQQEPRMSKVFCYGFSFTKIPCLWWGSSSSSLGSVRIVTLPKLCRCPVCLNACASRSPHCTATARRQRRIRMMTSVRGCRCTRVRLILMQRC